MLERKLNIKDFFGTLEPENKPVEKKTDKVRVYIGVNSDDTAIISLVPLVRWESEKQAILLSGYYPYGAQPFPEEH